MQEPAPHPLTPLSVRSAQIEDVDALIVLEESCFSMPWSRKNFEAELRGNQFSRLCVVPHPEAAKSVPFPIIAYVCCWLVFDELRILNLAVLEQFRKQGLARLLIQHVLDLGLSGGCERALLEVRASNMSARNLYRSFQFKEYAMRKSYYTNPEEDAILMSRDLLVPTVSIAGQGRIEYSFPRRTLLSPFAQKEGSDDDGRSNC